MTRRHMGGTEVNFYAPSITKGEWSASSFSFTPRKTCGTLWMESTMNPRVMLDMTVKKNANITARK
jgi:hypothetical protein